MLKHYAAGAALTAFAVFARPFGGFGSWFDFAYVGFFAAGIVCILTSPKDDDDND